MCNERVSERGVFHMEFGENVLLSHTMAAQIMMEEDSVRRKR